MCQTRNIGAVESSKKTDTLEFYKRERGTNVKTCTSGSICNDNVIRTTIWTGYVALPYVTDWAYASSESVCETNMQKQDSSNPYICKNNNWMQRSSYTWYLSPYAIGSSANYAWDVSGGGNVGIDFAASSNAVVPSIYLKSNVLIENGTGTSSDPYILKAGA